MAIDRDTALELADLRRQLATAQSLLSYEKTNHTSTRLEAAEEQRQLRVRLLHLEPEYKLLLADYNSHLTYTTELEDALAATTKRMTWYESAAARGTARVTRLEEKLRESSARNKALEDMHKGVLERSKELEERLKGRLLEEGTAQGALAAEVEKLKGKCAELDKENAELREAALKKAEKVAEVVEDYKKLKDEHKKLRASVKDVERELKTQAAAVDSLNQENEANKGTIKALTTEHEQAIKKLKSTHAAALKAAASPEEIVEARATIETLKDELQTLKVKLQDHVDRLAKSLTSKAATKAALESELATLRLELDDAQSTTQKAVDDATRAAKKEIASLEKQLASLRTDLDAARKAPPPPAAKDKDTVAALKRETKLREKAESELAELSGQYTALTTKLTSATSLLESTRAKLAATKTKKVTLPETDNKKRPGFTMEDLEQSTKRVRKEGPKVSDFSITPFLRKTVPVVGAAASGSEDPATPTMAGADTIAEMDATEQSVLLPAVVESKEPTRLLLAGAARKRKIAAEPAVEEEEEEAQSPEPELVKVRPKAKGKKAAAAGKVVEKVVEKELGIFDSPSSIPVPVKPVAAAKPKKTAAEKKEKVSGKEKALEKEKAPEKAPAATEKKAAAEGKKPGKGKGKGKGIMPTVFDEDDGTGRLVMNNFGTQDQPPLGGPAAAGGGGGASKKVMPAVGGDSGLMLVPVVSAFNRDISPAKKRPDALKKLFAGKK